MFKTATGMDLTPLKVDAGDGADNLYRQVGESVVKNALKKLVEGGYMTEGTSIASQVKELAETAKTLSSLYSSQDEAMLARLKEEREAREKAEKALAEARGASAKENIELFRLMMEAQARSEERFYTLIKELREQRSGGGDELTKTLAQLALQMLQGAANRDVREELQRQLDLIKLLREVSSAANPQLSLEDQIKLMTVTKELELKEREAKRVEEAERARGQLLEQAIGVLSQWAATRQGQQPVQRGEGGTPGVSMPLERFACPSCGEEIIVRGGKRPRLCAMCGAAIAPQVAQAAQGGE